jgi:hypothetical protein
MAVAAGHAAMGVPTASAQARLTVSPLIIELEAAAGDVLTEHVTVTASGDEPITVELVHADFGFGDDYQVVLIDDSAPETTAFSTRDWFSMPQQRYRIPAGQTRRLPLRIEVPANTPGGTYLGAALMRLVPPDTELDGSQVRAVAQSGPLVFIAVEGGDPPRPVVNRFDVPRLQRSGPIRPRLEIGNRGDEFFSLEGTVTLRGGGREDEVTVRRQYVVPGEPREIRAAAADGASDEGELRLGSSNLRLGRYVITSRLRMEPTGTTLVSTRTVWIVPTWVWLLGGLLLAVLVTLLVVLVQRIQSRRDDESAELDAADDDLESVDEHQDLDVLEDEDSLDRFS